MAKNGSTIKVQISQDLAAAFGFSTKTRIERDVSPAQKKNQATLKKVNRILERAIKEAENDPEYGISILRQCTWFVMTAMPNAKQDPKRATMLNQYKTLETCLAEVRQPDEYLTDMKAQFGNLDPKNYPTATDSVSNIISSQKDRIYRESQGFNTHEEEIFCVRRREFLTVIERAYNKLRNIALGVPSNAKETGRGR
jgi:hypothetical protein